VIPQGTQINSEAKTALSKSTLVFINYLTTAYSLLTSAMENMKMSSRKSMNSSDVFKALETLELDQSILTPVKEAVTSISN
jgi:hypothetical protein